MDVEERLKGDTRVVIPLGATEEHAHLSLLTDTLFVERVTREACEKAGVLVTPVMPFGCSAFSINFPGSISMRTETMCRVIEDIIDCLYRQGFRRLMFVTGHGGNEVITGVLSEAALDRLHLSIYYVDAWRGMKESVQRIERECNLPSTEHGAWHEDFPFTRVSAIPDRVKPPPASSDFPIFPLNPRIAKEHLGEGVVAGKMTIGHELTICLFQQCVDWLTEYLLKMPKEAPAA